MFDKKKMFVFCFVLLLVLIFILYLLLRKRKSTAKQSTTSVEKKKIHTAEAEQQSFMKNQPASDIADTDSEDTEIEEVDSELDADNAAEDAFLEEAIVAEEDLEEESEEELLEPDESTVFFWTPNGKSYHADPNCTYLKRSKTIMSGTEQEAKEAGKTTVCSVCSTTK